MLVSVDAPLLLRYHRLLGLVNIAFIVSIGQLIGYSVNGSIYLCKNLSKKTINLFSASYADSNL